MEKRIRENILNKSLGHRPYSLYYIILLPILAQFTFFLFYFGAFSLNKISGKLLWAAKGKRERDKDIGKSNIREGLRAIIYWVFLYISYFFKLATKYNGGAGIKEKENNQENTQ